MSWTFEGSCCDITLSLSEAGQWSVHGTASQRCSPISNDFEIVRHVRDLPGFWGIYSIEDAEHHYDGVGYGMKAFFADNGGNASAMIHYFSKTKDHDAAVGLAVVMPPEANAQVVATFRMLLTNPATRYVISPEFHGIGEEQTEHSPKLGDFVRPEILKSKAYFSRGVGISFHSASLRE